MGRQEGIIYAYDLSTIPSVLPAFANAKDLIVVDEVLPQSFAPCCPASIEKDFFWHETRRTVHPLARASLQRFECQTACLLGAEAAVSVARQRISPSRTAATCHAPT